LHTCFLFVEASYHRGIPVEYEKHMAGKPMAAPWRGVAKKLKVIPAFYHIRLHLTPLPCPHKASIGLRSGARLGSHSRWMASFSAMARVAIAVWLRSLDPNESVEAERRSVCHAAQFGRSNGGSSWQLPLQAQRMCGPACSATCGGYRAPYARNSLRFS
jgi:hypothetical protein